jgi:hypothetical protein
VDFALVMKSLLAEFDRLNIRCAAIGGFALGLLGSPRQTMDLDFLVHRDDLSKLEDVIGLKVQAMFNDPTRRSQEVADIERLAMLYGQRLDWDRIEEFYDLFGLGEEAKALQDRFGYAH